VTLLPRPARKAARPHQRYARGAPRRPHHHRGPGRLENPQRAEEIAFFSGLGAAYGRGRGDVFRLHGKRTTTSFLRSVVRSRLEGVRRRRISCRRGAYCRPDEVRAAGDGVVFTSSCALDAASTPAGEAPLRFRSASVPSIPHARESASLSLVDPSLPCPERSFRSAGGGGGPARRARRHTSTSRGPHFLHAPLRRPFSCIFIPGRLFCSFLSICSCRGRSQACSRHCLSPLHTVCARGVADILKFLTHSAPSLLLAPAELPPRGPRRSRSAASSSAVAYPAAFPHSISIAPRRGRLHLP